jgi:methionyl-tRNA formyltransferase
MTHEYSKQMTSSIIFAGTPANAAQTLQGLVSAGIEIELVITRPDAPFGRNRIVTPSPVALVALENGIPIIKTNIIDEETIEILKNSSSQLAIVVAFGVILKQAALDCVEKGWFNLHYSLLPAFRGAAPVQHAILSGASETGVTLFKIDSGLDTGPILAQVPALIEINDTTDSLLSRLTDLGVSLLLQELPGLFSERHPILTPQVGLASSAPKLSREDGKLSFDRTAKKLADQVAACHSEPGAWCYLNDEVLKIISARVFESTSSLAPGETISIGDIVVCGCADSSSLELLEVQPAGKSAMSASAWLRGKHSDVRLH